MGAAAAGGITADLPSAAEDIIPHWGIVFIYGRKNGYALKRV